MNKIDRYIDKKQDLIEINNNFIEELIEEIKRLSNIVEEKEKKNVELKLEKMKETEKLREAQNVLKIKEGQMKLFSRNQSADLMSEVKALKDEVEKVTEENDELKGRIKEYEKQLDDFKTQAINITENSIKMRNESFSDIIKEIEDMFSMCKTKKGNIKIDSPWYKRAGEKLEEFIDSYTISEDDINFVESYILIDISTYYGMLDRLLNSSPYINKVYNESIIKSRQIELSSINAKRSEFTKANIIMVNEILAKEKVPSKPVREVYVDMLKYFNENNTEQAKSCLEALFKRKTEARILNNTERITILFINYIYNTHIPTLETELKYLAIKQGYETILYNRLVQDKPALSYIESYRKNFIIIDSRVREKILNTLILICGEKEKKDNDNEYNLSEESEIKKLGYTVSLVREQRWNILKNKAIPKLGKKKVESHLRWLIKMNKGRKNRVNAVTEWEHDLRRVLEL